MSDLAWEDWIKQTDDPHGAFAKPEALDDLLVLDVSQESVAGMVCTSFLAELGAEVLKVEPPGEIRPAPGDHPIVFTGARGWPISRRGATSITSR